MMKFIVGMLTGIGLSIAIVFLNATRQILPGLEANQTTTLAAASELRASTTRALAEPVSTKRASEEHVIKEVVFKEHGFEEKVPAKRRATVNLNTLKPTPTEAAQPINPASQKFQVVWTPFRSKASAKGFARQLQDRLNQTFSVSKMAPGKYAVGFYYQNDHQRNQQLAAVESFITQN